MSGFHRPWADTDDPNKGRRRMLDYFIEGVTPAQVRSATNHRN